jgi:hypothetical protein
VNGCVFVAALAFVPDDNLRRRPACGSLDANLMRLSGSTSYPGNVFPAMCASPSEDSPRNPYIRSCAI